ncbi:hypothetical protein CROQUDRAFT_664162 [Cronartium quercuum f. sp. fusiforme G11]|uniref:Uncharacterized protein n=1 Tax=Cronartium quercuum f. sp. fusiforme G11 TaxID=708437 RepID=A0A9P6NBX2_9BASI|nr:hypothetical protein CROQUDRAFT_664162 [Cronartium quercuum f. sp. fusiforme G11]
MSTEEIAPFPPLSPSALEANEPKSKKSKFTDPILNESVLDQSAFPGRPPGLHPLTIPPLSPRQKLLVIWLNLSGLVLARSHFSCFDGRYPTNLLTCYIATSLRSR